MPSVRPPDGSGISGISGAEVVGIRARDTGHGHLGEAKIGEGNGPKRGRGIALLVLLWGEKGICGTGDRHRTSYRQRMGEGRGCGRIGVVISKFS